VSAAPTRSSAGAEKEALAGLPVLAASRVSKRFADGTLALTDVTLDVQRGEFVSIVGPSGCGKSTLLRITAGLSSASGGHVDTNCSSIGYVFQEPTLLPWRTVEANIELAPMLHGVKKAERRELVREAIELVNLDGFEKHYPRALSGGMAMRTSLARALTLQPDLFLFDEPFGALDAITRERLNEELLRIYAEKAFTGVFVTHAISEAVYLSTRVVVMSGRPGRIVATVDVPFAYPRSLDLRFTAEFTEISHQVSQSLRDVYQ
jgi:NitT/TauT family transport system ATP-binding protein